MLTLRALYWGSAMKCCSGCVSESQGPSSITAKRSSLGISCSSGSEILHGPDVSQKPYLIFLGSYTLPMEWAGPTPPSVPMEESEPQRISGCYPSSEFVPQFSYVLKRLSSQSMFSVPANSYTEIHSFNHSSAQEVSLKRRTNSLPQLTCIFGLMLLFWHSWAI